MQYYYETLHFFSRVVYYSLANMKIGNKVTGMGSL